MQWLAQEGERRITYPNVTAGIAKNAYAHFDSRRLVTLLIVVVA